jgi:alpha-tubulin suppressor-like RCC1 family protein
LDLLSASLKGFLLSGTASEVYSWGNGANYQLGTGAEGLQLTPNRLDNLHGTPITALAAAKFHSMALAEDGTLYTWGFGRGGRLGAHLSRARM